MDVTSNRGREVFILIVNILGSLILHQSCNCQGGSRNPMAQTLTEAVTRTEGGRAGCSDQGRKPKQREGWKECSDQGRNPNRERDGRV